VERKDETRELLEAMPLMRLVPVAGHTVSQRVGRILGDQDGLTGSSAGVLMALGLGGGAGPGLGVAGRATHADLARRCMITPATVTGVVNTLVKAGYVRRERDEADRRVVWLVATESGWARVRQIGRELYSLAAPVMESLPKDEELVVRRFLTRVILHYLCPEDWESPGQDTAPPGDTAPTSTPLSPAESTTNESRHAA
jgi:DNA-binding MarR family transcriptional regulator